MPTTQVFSFGDDRMNDLLTTHGRRQSVIRALNLERGEVRSSRRISTTSSMRIIDDGN